MNSDQIATRAQEMTGFRAWCVIVALNAMGWGMGYWTAGGSRWIGAAVTLSGCAVVLVPLVIRFARAAASAKAS